MIPKPIRWTPLFSALLAALVGTPEASADKLDPSMPKTVVLGPARAYAPSDRFDTGRTGQAPVSLPSAPLEQWRRHVSGGIDLPPLVDGDGNILVLLTVPEIVKIAPDSSELWRARLGTSAAAAPATLLADGTIALVTTAGVVWGFTKSGAVRFSSSVRLRGRDADVAPLALADGGLAVAAANTVVILDADGNVRSRATLGDRSSGTERIAGGLLESDTGILMTTDVGNVYRLRPPAAPSKIGTLGGALRRGAVLASSRTLVGVVDGHRLMALDLPTGTTHALSGGVPVDGPPTVVPGGRVLLTTTTGTLLVLDPAGNERLHLSLERQQALFGTLLVTGLGTVGADPKNSPPLIVDPSGRIGFVRSAGRAGVVNPDGKVVAASERICNTPVAVTSAGRGRMLFTCHDGGLWMFGE